MSNETPTLADPSRGMGILIDQIKLIKEKSVKQIEKTAGDPYEVLYELLPICYQSLNIKGEIIEVNSLWLKTLDRKKEDVIGKWFGDVVVPEQRELFRARFEKFKELGEVNCVEFDFRKKDGTKVILAFDGKILYDNEGNFIKTLCLGNNVTDRKAEEFSLRCSESYFRMLANNAPVMIWLADAEMKCTFINNTWLNFTGKPFNSNEEYDWRSDILPEDFKLIDKVLTDAFLNNSSFELEYRMRHYTGEYRWIVNRGEPYTDRDGVYTGFIGVCIDINDRKKAEEQLEKSSEELQALNASKDKFFSIIAHDLKSPLSGLVGITHEIARDIDHISHEELAGSAEIMYESALQVYKLMENLLEWSKISMQKIQIIPENFNLYDLASNAVTMVQVSAVRKNISIENNIDRHIEVIADMNMVNTVLRNLLSNAIKYSFNDTRIELNTAVSGSTVLVSVKDFGTGMTQAKIKSLFKIESKQSDLGTAGETGTGLGLILCHEFIKANGGEIYVQSKPSKGSTVSFSLNRG